MMDKVLRLVRLRADKKPFGGLQMILTGDFFQLGPIKPSMELFNDQIWDDTIHETVILDQIYRQKKQEFIELLMKLRTGEIDDSVCSTIQQTTLNDLEHNLVGVKPTILYARNRDVDAMNREELDKLPGEAVIFDAEDRDIVPNTPQRLPEQLALKVGAQVMILVNDEPELGIVNGARGVVFDLDRPERVGVRLLSGKEVYLSKTTHETARDAPLLPSSRRQFPLKLAWAITIHKCQGMTIDYLVVDLAGCFAPGQAYTAISRGTQLENMTIRNFTRNVVITNHAVTAFHARCLSRKKRPCSFQTDEPVKLSKYFSPT
jgi:ATP-dependent DNA helicase PIF1